MSEPERSVDLSPHEWNSSDGRPKPKEPIFQPGGLLFLGAIVGGALGAAFLQENGYTGTVGGVVLGVILGAVVNLVVNASRS